MDTIVTVKEQARQLIEQLPEQATWEEIMQQIFVCQAIAQGLADRENGRTLAVEKVVTSLQYPRASLDSAE